MTLTLAPMPIVREETPGDYWRLKFDGSTIPSKKIVGLLACQREWAMRTCHLRPIPYPLFFAIRSIAPYLPTNAPLLPPPPSHPPQTPASS
jgi:hypothetical protein